MTLRLVLASAFVSAIGTAALAGPTVAPNASAITAVTPVPLTEVEVEVATVATQTPVQQTAPVQAAPAPAPQSAFIANYVASFSR